jgi:hypothetical protein
MGTDQLPDLLACPVCGDPGFLNENDGRRYCGNAGCDHTPELGAEPPHVDCEDRACECIVSERDRLRAENEALRDALAELVRLKDGPRDDAYRAAKDAAWDAGRAALASDEGQAP